jgi:hypothetical protein
MIGTPSMLPSEITRLNPATDSDPCCGAFGNFERMKQQEAEFAST